MSRFFKDNGLTIVLLLLFVGSILGHWITGWHFQNEQLQDHGEPPITLVAFLSDPQFLSTVRWVYGHSLGTVLFLLFIASFLMHWMFSAREAAEEALNHGATPLTPLQYLTSAQLWFESFQNWQSEFLSTALIVVLSIFLREVGSPESKPVSAAHAETGA